MLEAHVAFDIPVTEILDISIYANAYNLLNTKYLSLSYDGTDHDASDAFVIFGLPLSWDVGVRIGL
jgi:hypothetical protein